MIREKPLNASPHAGKHVKDFLWKSLNTWQTKTQQTKPSEETMKGEDSDYMSGVSAGQNSRQPEIDALKNELSLRAHGEKRAHQRIEMLYAEVARLKADAETLCKAGEEMQIAINELWKAEYPEELDEDQKHMDIDPAREMHTQAWRALNAAIYYMRKNAAMKDFSTHQKEER
jgi:hypothetical protein